VTFLKNQWYLAAFAEELGAEPLGRTLLGEKVVFYRRADGQVTALEDRCAHRQAALSQGRVVGDAIECNYHGLQFDHTGACVCVPGQTRIPNEARVRAYPVRERQGFIFIWMGDADLAAAQTPYDFPIIDKPGWRTLHAQFHGAFDYHLLIDNLTDVSHITFAHRTTIGAAGVVEGAETEVETDGASVRITRWMENIEPAPAHIKATGKTGKVDRWQIVTFTPPGFIWLEVGVAEAGTGVRGGNRNGVILDRHTLHAVTPETATGTHYFWTSAHDGAAVSVEAEQVIYDQSVQAFGEDLMIIEAQQMRIGDGLGTVRIEADGGLAAARNIMTRLIDAEQSSA